MDLRQKTYHNLNICKEKTFDKNSKFYHGKNSRDGTFLNIINVIYEKPTAKIILYGKKLDRITVKSGIRHGCTLSPLLFNIMLRELAGATRQDNKVMKLKKY